MKLINLKRSSQAKSLTASGIVAGILFLALAAVGFPKGAAGAVQASFVVWAVFASVIGFLILYTGVISKWRAVFFVTLALAFIAHFKAFLLGLGGNPLFSPNVQEVPYCHIAIASSFFNHLYQQYLALQSGNWSVWGPLTFGALWLFVTLSIGQAWCSWACMYGGLDDGFSRLLPKPLFKNFKIPAPLRDLPAAVLVSALLISLGTMLPVFCLWVCPLKVTTAFLDTSDPVRTVQIWIFSVVGIGFLVLLPLIFGKRFFCGLICPFGAWQAFFGRINPFRVTISKESCTHCGLCVRSCPTLVLTDESFQTQTVNAYCNRCGECIDACPGGAIQYTLLGKKMNFSAGGVPGELLDVRAVFIFCSLFVGGSLGGVFVPQVLAQFAAFLWK